VNRCPADAGMCLVVELQTVEVGASASLQSRAWAKLFLFEGARLLAGRWCVPFRHLPVDETDITDSLQACAHVEPKHILRNVNLPDIHQASCANLALTEFI